MKSRGELRNYLKFYQQLPREIKGLGLVLIIAAVVVLPVGLKYEFQGMVASLLFLLALSTLITIVSTRLIVKSSTLANQESESLAYQGDLVLVNVLDVTNHINKVLEAEMRAPGEVEMLNYGLDFETVIPWLDYQVLRKRDIEGLNYKGLMIDIESDSIKHLINGESNMKSAYAIIAKKKYSELDKEKLKQRNIKIEIRTYPSPPVIHGFLINDQHLYIGFTEIIKGKLHGGCFPYRYYRYNKDCPLNVHYFRLFKSWFHYVWENSSPLS